jgi:hypothetical protein
MIAPQQIQQIVVEKVQESTELKILLAIIPVVVVFMLGKLFGRK